MGMITKVLGLKLAHKAAQKLQQRGERKQAQFEAEQAAAGVPAPVHGARARGNAIARKAGDFYHRNPKLVASFATVLLAGLAATVARRRGLY